MEARRASADMNKNKKLKQAGGRLDGFQQMVRPCLPSFLSLCCAPVTGGDRGRHVPIHVLARHARLPAPQGLRSIKPFLRRNITPADARCALQGLFRVYFLGFGLGEENADARRAVRCRAVAWRWRRSRWTTAEDSLLAAIVHDFADNWSLVSLILSISSALQGVYRRPDLCRHRFKATGRQGWSREQRSTQPPTTLLPYSGVCLRSTQPDTTSRRHPPLFAHLHTRNKSADTLRPRECVIELPLMA